jgi:hypothetical protein
MSLHPDHVTNCKIGDGRPNEESRKIASNPRSNWALPSAQVHYDWMDAHDQFGDPD